MKPLHVEGDFGVIGSVSKQLGVQPGLHVFLKISLLFGWLGWIVLVFNTGDLGLIPEAAWRIGAGLAAALTVRVAFRTTVEHAVQWWLYIFAYGILRAIAYAVLGAWSPLGVWVLVTSGLMSTVLLAVMFDRFLEMRK